MTRCKVICDKKTIYPTCGELSFRAVINGSPENELFFKYTPNGQITLSVVSPEILEQFVPGQEYYVDFTGLI